MRSAREWLDEYGASHQNATNKLIHWVCVPLIVWTVVALLWSIPTPALFDQAPFLLNWAIVALVLAQIWYFFMSPRLAIGILAFLALCLWLSWWLERVLPVPLWAVAVVVFVLAWIGQFIGHHIEGKRPSFFKDLQFLLVGPAWLMSFLYERVGIRV